jgi:hypothetical protein
MIMQASTETLAGRVEGLHEAADVVQRGIERGMPLARILFEILERADRVNVYRSMSFDERLGEFVVDPQ